MPYRTTRRVEFRDTDMAGIAHFSAFVFYMESVEHEFLRSCGLSVVSEDKAGELGWPRVSIQCDFSAPVRFEDQVDIELTVERLGEKSITYAFDFTLDGVPAASGQLTTVCCRRTEAGGIESVAIPAWFREKLSTALSQPVLLKALMSYLEDLTWRLASGVARLPEALRERQAAYLLAQQRADGGFAGREGASDLYYTGFGLRGLALTGQLHGAAAERAMAFLREKMHAQVPIVDFLSLVYGAMLLEQAAGLDVFATAAPDWRDAVAAALERFRRPDGGYAKTDDGQSSSTYYSFLMVLCHQLIGRPTPEPERLVAFIHARRRTDGGFVELGPMQRSGTNPTAAAIGILKVLDVLDPTVHEATLDFLAQAATDEGGLRANTRIPVADVLSTFTGLLTLGDLGALDEFTSTGDVDLQAIDRYVRSMEQPDGGFRGGIWDDATDVEYTFYGLGALALVANAKDGEGTTDEHG